MPSAPSPNFQFSKSSFDLGAGMLWFGDEILAHISKWLVWYMQRLILIKTLIYQYSQTVKHPDETVYECVCLAVYVCSFPWECVWMCVWVRISTYASVHVRVYKGPVYSLLIPRHLVISRARYRRAVLRSNLSYRASNRSQVISWLLITSPTEDFIPSHWIFRSNYECTRLKVDRVMNKTNK